MLRHNSVEDYIKITINEPDGKRTITLRDRRILIGREGGTPVDIVISDPCVSRCHGKIFLSEGKFWYEDFNSTHGSKINDDKITEPKVLSEGVKIEIGTTLLEVEEINIQRVDAPSKKEIQKSASKLKSRVFTYAGLTLLIGFIWYGWGKFTGNLPNEPIAEFNDLVIKGERVYVKSSETPFTGSAICSYTNSQLWAKVRFESGREDGTYRIWYEDGTLMHQAEYVMGIFSGSVKWWAPDGSLALEMTYLDGQETELISHSGFTIPINAIPQIAE